MVATKTPRHLAKCRDNQDSVILRRDDKKCRLPLVTLLTIKKKSHETSGHWWELTDCSPYVCNTKRISECCDLSVSCMVRLLSDDFYIKFSRFPMLSTHRLAVPQLDSLRLQPFMNVHALRRSPPYIQFCSSYYSARQLPKIYIVIYMLTQLFFAISHVSRSFLANVHIHIT